MKAKAKKTRKAPPRKKTGGMRIFAVILMVAVVVLLAFIVYWFVNGLHSAQRVTPKAVTQSVQRQPRKPALYKPPQSTEPRPRYDFYQELSQRRAEVDAELKKKNSAVGQVSKTAPPTAPPATAPREKPLSGNYYRVQVGAFREAEQADHIRAQMIWRGYSVTMVQSGALHIVQIGPYSEKSEAQAVAQKLEHEGIKTLIRTFSR